jgi:hypothetical protein
LELGLGELAREKEKKGETKNARPSTIGRPPLAATGVAEERREGPLSVWSMGSPVPPRRRMTQREK